MNKPRSVMLIDMAYTHDIVKRKRHEQFFLNRDSGGYFSKVFGVHPIADIANGTNQDKIEFIRFSENQTLIEGSSRLHKWPRFLYPLNFLISQYKLLKVLSETVKRENISVISTADPFYSGILGLLTKKRTGRPLAVFVYGNFDDIYEDTGKVAMPRLIPFRFLEQWVAKWVFSNADLVVGGNKNNLGYAVKNGAQGRMTAVFPVSKYMDETHLAPPEQRETPDALFREFGIPASRKYLLYVGRLVDVKRPDDVVKAMRIVIEKDPTAVGILSGDGPMRNELQAMIDSSGMTGKIFLIGNQDQKTLSKLTPLCITLSPLTGMALIECGLGGSPIVAYDRDWQPEFVSDNESGFIVPFRDYRSMAERALRILEDRDLYEKFSKNIRETALRYSDTKTLFEKEHRVYEEMFSNADNRKHA